jgi:hypothetical protein
VGEEEAHLVKHIGEFVSLNANRFRQRFLIERRISVMESLPNLVNLDFRLETLKDSYSPRATDLLRAYESN